MADKEFLDIFVRLKGEFKDLEKLKKGIDVKVNLDFNKSNGGGFSKLEKLMKGIDIKVNLKFSGLEKLEKLQKEGITIKTKFSSPTSSGTQGKGGKSSLSNYMEQEQIRLEKAFANSTKQRKADVDRQLKQLFEAKAYRAKQAKQKSNDFLDDLFSSVSEFRAASNRPSSKSGPRSVIGGSIQRRLEQQAFPAQSSEEAREEFIADRLAQRQRQRAVRENLRRAREARFRSRVNRQRAQEELDLVPSFSNFDEERERVAYNFGLLPGDLKSGGPSRRGIAKATGGFIDPRRLKGAGREIGFAGLFGAQSGFAHGGILGGILGGLGGLAGATAGGSINGAEGAFIGATGVEVVSQILFRTFDGIKEKLLDVSRAGLQFEESILGISSVLQATTSVRGPGGQSLSIGEQLKFQEGRARQIQLTARKKLLPLGIGGETEAAIVQGLITGFAQKGIQLSPDEIATLASRFGGAIQAQRPDLLQNINRLRLELEDSISNPGRNTALTPVIRAFAPALGKATSGADALKLTTGLEAFPQALTSNTDSVVQALRKFNTEIENLKVNFGSDLLRGLTPSINELTRILNKSDVQKGLSNLATTLGEFAAKIVGITSNLTDFLAKSPINNPGSIGNLLGGLGGAAGGAAVGGLLGTLFGPGGTLIGASLGGFAGTLFGAPAGKAAALEADAKERERKNDEFEQEVKNRKNTSQPNILTLVNSLLEKSTGGSSSIGRAQLGKLFLPLLAEELRQNLEESALKLSEGKERDDFIKTITSQIATATAQFKSEISKTQIEGFRESFENRKNTFDTFLASGQASRAKFEIAGLGQERKLLLGSKDLILKEIDTIKKETAEAPEKTKKNLDFLVSQESRLIEARKELARVNEELIKNENEVAQAARRLSEALRNRLQELLSITDTGTRGGQEKALNLRILETQKQKELLKNSFNKGEISRKEFDLKSQQLNVRSAEEGREKELVPLDRGQLFVQAEKSLFDFQHLQSDLNNALEGYKINLESASIASKQAALAQTRAVRSLEDYIADTNLRKLGRQGQKIAAAERIVAAGGDSPIDQQLVRGAPGFSEEVRKRYELELAQEEFNSLDRQSSDSRVNAEENEGLQERKLGLQSTELSKRSTQLQIDQAQRALDFEPINRISQTISQLTELTKLKQFLGPGSNIFNRLEKDITATGPVKELFEKAGFKDFADFERALDQQSKVKGNEFDDILSSESFPALNPILGELSDIKAIVKEILNKMSTFSPLKREAERKEEERKKKRREEYPIPEQEEDIERLNESANKFDRQRRRRDPGVPSPSAPFDPQMYRDLPEPGYTDPGVPNPTGPFDPTRIKPFRLPDPYYRPDTPVFEKRKPQGISIGFEDGIRPQQRPEEEGLEARTLSLPEPKIKLPSNLNTGSGKLPSPEGPLPDAPSLKIPAGQKGVFKLGFGQDSSYTPGSKSSDKGPLSGYVEKPNYLEEKYYKPIVSMSDNEFEAYLEKNKSDPRLQKLKSTFYKWRYPPGNLLPNVLDRYDMESTISLLGSESERSGARSKGTQADLMLPEQGGSIGSDQIDNVLTEILTENEERYRKEREYYNKPTFQRYAKGGRPKPNVPAIVGEKGPELFIPDSKGTVIASNLLNALTSHRAGPRGLEPDIELNSNNMSDVFERSFYGSKSLANRQYSGRAITPREINTSMLQKMGSLPKTVGPTPEANKNLTADILGALVGLQQAVVQQTKDNAQAYKSALTSTFAGN